MSRVLCPMCDAPVSLVGRVNGTLRWECESCGHYEVPGKHNENTALLMLDEAERERDEAQAFRSKAVAYLACHISRKGVTGIHPADAWRIAGDLGIKSGVETFLGEHADDPCGLDEGNDE